MIIKAIQIEVSCVAQSTEQFFSLEILHRRSKTFCEFSASRLPVGSSAIKSSGLQITALAIAKELAKAGYDIAIHKKLAKLVSNLVTSESKKESIDVNAKNKDGWTPLHLAATKGRIEIVEYLVEKGAEDVNAKNEYGQTPLHIAILLIC